MKNIVCIMPHPDDLACGMGGTALLLKKKYSLHVLCMTLGQRGLSKKPSDTTAAMREKEERAAAKFIDAKVEFMGEMDGEVFAGREICEKVASRIKRIKPVAVFSTWPIDLHPDHAAVSEIARKALLLSKSSAEFYMCAESMRWQTRQFVPDLYVDITGVIEMKSAMIRCHSCQNHNDGLSNEIHMRDSVRGCECGCQYAEGFKTILPTVTKRESVLLGL